LLQSLFSQHLPSAQPQWHHRAKGKNRTKATKYEIYSVKVIADRERLSAFEMWVWRRMEKIGWADRVSNDEVLQRV